MSIVFFAPKLIYALIHIPVGEISRPLATYVTRARPRDFVARSFRFKD